MKYLAGVDSSTQSCKVVIRDPDTGAVIRSGRAPHPEGTAVDPEAWWQALLLAIQDAGGLHDVAAISVGAQQHGMVALDSEGRVVRDALLWNDVSTAGQTHELNRELGRQAWVHATGLPLAASFTVTKVRWLSDYEPHNAARVAAVALPHDYLTWRLRGYGPGRAELGELTTDRSDASGTGYWSPFDEGYRHDLFRHAFGRDVILPRVLPWDGTAGTTTEGIPGVPAGIVIGVGGGDNAVAALGLGLEVGDAVVSIGTSGTVYVKTTEPVRDLTGPVSSYADATGHHLPLIATLNAARVLAAATELLGCGHDRVADLALSAPPGAQGVTLLPYFEGERLPDLPDATATLSGLTLRNTRPENLARAFAEGMLCGLASGLDAIRATGVGAGRVLMIGGGARSAAVQDIGAQIFDLPLVIPSPDEYVTIGAAKQAHLALTGRLPDWSVTIDRELDVDLRPGIREQHRVAMAAAGIPEVPVQAGGQAGAARVLR